MVVEVYEALHEEGRRVGEHAQDPRTMIDPIPVGDGPVGGLMPDREGEVNGQEADRHMDS